MVGARSAVVLVLFAVFAVVLSTRALGGSSGPVRYVDLPPIDAATTTTAPVLRSETIPTTTTTAPTATFPTTTTTPGCLVGTATRTVTPLPGLELPAGTPLVVAGHNQERGWLVHPVGDDHQTGWVLTDGVDVDFDSLTPCA